MCALTSGIVTGAAASSSSSQCTTSSSSTSRVDATAACSASSPPTRWPTRKIRGQAAVPAFTSASTGVCKAGGATTFDIGDYDDNGSSGQDYDLSPFWAEDRPRPSQSPSTAARHKVFEEDGLSESGEFGGDPEHQFVHQRSPTGVGPSCAAGSGPPVCGSWNATPVLAPGLPRHVATDRNSSDSDATVPVADQQEAYQKYTSSSPQHSPLGLRQRLVSSPVNSSPSASRGRSRQPMLPLTPTKRAATTHGREHKTRRRKTAESSTSPADSLR